MREERISPQLFEAADASIQLRLGDLAVTYRMLGLASLFVVVAALQMGCCSSPCGKGMGCGRTYWGAYYDDPPTCEPCDKCGNFTGGNKRCKQACNGGCDDNYCDFDWARGTRVTLLGGLFNCDMFNGGGKQSCTQASCGEPACGEPGCGSTPDCGCNYGAYESSPVTSFRASNVSYSRNAWSNAAGSGGCNCGKQH